MPIIPDDKNWTWVLERACLDCGFDASTFDPSTAAAAIDANVAEWEQLLRNPRAGDRPDDHTWSAGEYACHVRDVFRLYLYRLDLMLGEDGPHFPNWDQDETAIAERYHEQRPVTVVADLQVAARMLSARLATVQADGWKRTGFRGDGVAFTVDTFTRYLMHDPIHHVWDARRGYAVLGVN